MSFYCKLDVSIAAVVYLKVSLYIFAPVAQRIEYELAELVIEVRFLAGAVI